LVGLVAGVVVAVASWFCGALPDEYPTVWPGIEPWRSVGGSPLAATVVFAALAVMVYAWWAVRDLDVTVRWLWVTAVAWFGPLVLSAPLFSRDVYSYAVQGLMLHQGLDPYSQQVSALDSPWAASAPATTTPAPYGPLFLQIARLAAAASCGHLLVAVFLLRLLVVAGVVVIAWAVPVIARRLGEDPARATWLAVLCPLVGVHLVSGAHNDGLMVAGMLSGVALALSDHASRAGPARLAVPAVALAATVKAPAAVVVPFLAVLWASQHAGHGRPQVGLGAVTWTRLVSRLVLAGLATAAVVVGASVGLGLGLSWLTAVSSPGQSVQWTSLPTAWGMAARAVGNLLGLASAGGAVTLFRLLGLVVLAGALVALWLHGAAHHQDRRLVVQSAGLAVLAVLVLAPSFRAWYFLWALPLLAVTTPGRRALTAYAAVASVLAFAVLPGGYSLALTATSVGVPLVVLASALLLGRGIRWARRRGGRAGWEA
jgi:alpha-1,6-mannosyltransferase